MKLSDYDCKSGTMEICQLRESKWNNAMRMKLWKYFNKGKD